MFKRAFLSITRRKSKSILLFIILFVVANLIITTIAIKNSADESVEFAKQSIGSEVTLSIDMQGLRQNLRNGGTSSTGTRQGIEIPEISIEDALSIANSKYISSYSYGFDAYANVKDMDTVESEMEKMGEVEVPNDAISGTTNGRGQMPGNGNFTMNMGDFRQNLVAGDVTIEATNSFSNLSGVKSGTLELVNGEASSLDEENTVIVSYDFAELNELTVGSEITLIHTESEQEITLTVVGIYENSETGNDMRNMLMNSSNTMYVNLSTGEKFMTEEKYNEGNYGIDSCVYYLTEPENYEVFVEEAETKVDLEANNLKLSIDESTYQRMVGSIESIGNFSQIILVVVIFASVLLVTLIINAQIKERNYEMGVLLSLGEKKAKIVGQIAIELVVIATVAFVLSTFTGTLISNVIGDNLSATQQDLRQEQMDYASGGMYRPGMSAQNNQTEVESVDIDVSVGVTECLILFGLGYVISLLAMILPAVNIFRYDPKNILTRRD